MLVKISPPDSELAGAASQVGQFAVFFQMSVSVDSEDFPKPGCEETLPSGMSALLPHPKTK